MLTTLSDFDRVPRILRLNIAGQPVEWVAWQDAVCLYARDLVIWTVGDPLVTIRGGRSKLSGETSTRDIHSIIACNGRVVARPSQLPPLSNPALFKRDGC
jgi:hypothetical protein